MRDNRSQARRVLASLSFLAVATLAIAISAISLMTDGANSTTAAKTTPAQMAQPINAATSSLLQKPVRQYSKTIGFVGDSLTFGCCTNSTPAPELEMKLLGGGYVAINRGVNGSTTTDWLDDLLEPAMAEFKTQHVEVVQVMLGTNDASGGRTITVEEIIANLRKIARRLLNNGAKVVMINELPYGQWTDDNKVQAINRALSQVEWGDGVYLGATESYDYFKQHQEQLEDGLHMDQAGYQQQAEFWAEALKRVLKNAS